VEEQEKRVGGAERDVNKAMSGAKE